MTGLSQKDSEQNLLFKHFETLNSYLHNLKKFNEAIEAEAAVEGDILSKLISAKEVKRTQTSLNELFTEAQGYKDSLLTILMKATNGLKKAIYHEEEVRQKLQEKQDKKRAEGKSGKDKSDLNKITISKDLYDQLATLSATVDRLSKEA